MAKKKINKLVVPLTLKTVSLLGAFTVMTTSIGGCAQKKKDSGNHSSTSTSTSSDTKDKLNNNSDTVISDQKDGSSIEEKDNQNSTTSKENTNQANNSTTNNQTKPNKNTNNTQTNNTNDGNKQQPSNSGNNSNAPSQGNNTTSENKFVPLTASNINDVNVFNRAVLEVARNTRGNFGGGWGYYYNGQLYHSVGIPYDEFKYILVCLNKDYLSDDTVAQLLGSYSKDELNRFVYIMDPMIGFVENANRTNIWDGLVINQKNLNDLKKIESGFISYRFNNDPNILKNMLRNYDNSNPIVGYYLTSACSLATRNASFKDDEIVDKYIDLTFEVKPKCDALSSNMYNRSHGKSKTLG